MFIVEVNFAMLISLNLLFKILKNEIKNQSRHTKKETKKELVESITIKAI